MAETVTGCSGTLAAAPTTPSWLPVSGNNAEAHSVTADPATVPAAYSAATPHAGELLQQTCWEWKRLVASERDLSMRYGS